MKTLSTPLATQAAASQSAWAELYDIYLKTAIVTPAGTTSILRLTNCPGGLNFFAPQVSPEPSATQGDAAAYTFWPLKREQIKGNTEFANDKLQIAASNVSTQFSQMLAAVSWYDTPIVIRKLSLTIAAPTADDCAILWTGAIDAAKITETTLTFDCSSDLATLAATLPRENMHQTCRFNWADDFCTKIRFLADNYKSKTVKAGSTTTTVLSDDLTEDSGSDASYGTDRLNALADGAFTQSNPTGPISAPAYPVKDAFGVYDHCLMTNSVIRVGDVLRFSYGTGMFAGPLPSGLSSGTDYYVVDLAQVSPVAWVFQVSLSPGGSWVDLGTFDIYTIHSITMTFGYASASAGIKSSATDGWLLMGNSQWGTAANGYFLIPDAQSGTQNCALQPYVTIDLGTARALKLWTLASPADVQREDLVRLILIAASTDNSTWQFMRHFELPPAGGIDYECRIPFAISARYWRICIRSKWGPNPGRWLLRKVQAYDDGRHFWKSGRLTFASNTTTAALQGISAAIVESYAGKLVVADLPTDPVAGDTFAIERGCSRSFNDCCERQNLENFGGFTDLPYQAVIR